MNNTDFFLCILLNSNLLKLNDLKFSTEKIQTECKLRNCMHVLVIF